ncbi:MAG TPA: hypothetical protein VK666_03695 [Chryseolinea sp.]|nr:hypothetical protein [Chryseolinea sp.]
MKKSLRSAVSTVILVVVIFALGEACVDHTLPATDEFSCATFTEVSFDADIEPIINTKCAITGDGGCHNGGNGPSLDWRVFSNFQDHASNVKDRVTRPASTAGHMPKIGTLTDDQIRLLVCWVEQGAQDN